MEYDFCLVTAVKRDGTEYEVLGLLRSLEMLDIQLPVFIAIFNHPPKFDLIQELEVCGDLECLFDVDDEDLEAAVKSNIDQIVKGRYRRIAYVDRRLRVYGVPEVPEGVTTLVPSDMISYKNTDALISYMKATLDPELFNKCNISEDCGHSTAST